ncbi:Uncharacterised protein [Vibrio cholerae]|uniref:Uncharacterized protein n=1 Tax=Vibrio cholerae TaxID=666 RepID=A0A655ZBZ6_VIBCL|nr:Uncharacterised protein [Vibrio cholerae]CSC66835.1 Uncharacterised protein [Vibrio cholerae]
MRMRADGIYRRERGLAVTLKSCDDVFNISGGFRGA